jgi:ATP-binding cassette subfamily B protein
VTVLPSNGDLVAENLSFRYGGPHEPWVLRHVALAIPEGKITAVVGSSGSGKTTLSQAVAQLLQPDRRRYPAGRNQFVQY